MEIRRFIAVPLAIAGAVGITAALEVTDALAGTATATSQQQTHPSVSPRVGGKRTTYTVSFTMQQTPRRVGTLRSYYRVEVSPPAHAGSSCTPAQPGPITSGTAGSMSRVRLHPTARSWCAGRYHVTVFWQSFSSCGPPIDREMLVCPESPGIEPSNPLPYENLDVGDTHFTVR